MNDVKLTDFTETELDILLRAITFRRVYLELYPEKDTLNEMETLNLLRTQVKTAIIEVQSREIISQN